MLIPHDKTKNGVIMEIKRADKRKNNESDEDFVVRVGKHLKQAMQQIDQNKYYKELIDNGIPPENIVKVPVIFIGKEPYVTAPRLHSKDFEF